MSVSSSSNSNGGGVLLEVRDLKTYFYRRGRFGVVRREDYVPAVDGVSFHLKEGETLGLVGESGCGKSRMTSRWWSSSPTTSS